MLIVALLISLFVGNPGWAEPELLVVKFTETSTLTDHQQARQEMVDKAISEATAQYIRDLIGTQKYEHHLPFIKHKILKNSGKYVLYLKETAQVFTPTQSSMTIEMKLSLKNLEAILLEEGLLYKSDGPPRVLPLVVFSDKTHGNSWSWWVSPADEHTFLTSIGESFHEMLKRDLRDVGFFGLNPSTGNYLELSGPWLRSDTMSPDHLLSLGQYFQASIIIRGTFTVKATADRSDVYNLDWKLTALHTGNGREIGEVVRSFETEAGPFQAVTQRKIQDVLPAVCSDLTSQLVEAWKSGTFGAALLKLTVRGDLDYPQVTQFKKFITDQVKEIKTLRERLMAPGQVEFELDSSVSSEQLAQILKDKSFQNFHLTLESQSADGIVLKAQRM